MDYQVRLLAIQIREENKARGKIKRAALKLEAKLQAKGKDSAFIENALKINFPSYVR